VQKVLFKDCVELREEWKKKKSEKGKKRKKEEVFQIDVKSLQVCSPEHSPPTPPSCYSLKEN